MEGIIEGTVTLKPYQKEYSLLAEQTISLLHQIMKEEEVQIEHIGSTAIRSICSKPVLDIAVGVPDLSIVYQYRDALEKKGFLFAKEKLGGTVIDFVCKKDEKRTHLIHFVIWNGDRWKEFVLFRDYLNAHPSLCKEYEALKIELASKYAHDNVAYTRGKSAFIRMIMKKAQKGK